MLPGSRMNGINRPGSRLPLVAVATLAVLVVAGQAVAIAAAPAQHAVTAATLALLDLLGAVCAWRTAELGLDRAAWRLIAVGRVLAVVANVAFGAATAMSGLREQVWWWCGALAGTAMYAVLSLGVVSFPARRLHGWQRAALAAEAVAILGGGFMFTWYFILQPYLAMHPDPSRSLLTVGFPIGDLLLLIAISTMLLRGGLAGPIRPVTVLVAGLTVYLLADTAFDGVSNDGNHATGPVPATVAVVIASLLMTTATIWQHARITTGGEPEDGTVGSGERQATVLAYFPYATVGLGYALMLVVTIRDGQLMTWGGLVIGLIVMAGAVAVRQLISLRESRHVDITDTLTGLPNRIGLHQALSRALRHGHPVAV
ncbi:hypothetical protein, partial [Micromonospora sp. NPDC003776]